jgi:hypothetical protein
MHIHANIWHLIGPLNQTAADGIFPLNAFKPSSSDSADRGCSFIRVTVKIQNMLQLSPLILVSTMKIQNMLQLSPLILVSTMKIQNMLQLSPLILVSIMKIQNMLQLPPSIVCLVTYIYSINNSFGMTIVILPYKYVN